MKNIMFFLALIGLIFVNSTQTYAQPDPQEKVPGMKLEPVYTHSHQGGEPIPAELVIEIQQTGQKSNAPLWALEQATIYRLKTVGGTFEEETGNSLDIEQYLGPEKTWHEKINNPDNRYLVSNRSSPGREIWTYGWLPSDYTAPNGTVYPQGWYYFKRNLYMVGEKGYTEPEGTIDLNLGAIFNDVSELQGVMIAWYADGCANPSLPDEVPFKEAVVEKRRTGGVDPFTGSNWTVSAQVSYGQQLFQPAPQQYYYVGGWGVGFGAPCAPFVPMLYNNCINCGCNNCGGYVNTPQQITNIYEGDVYEGDTYINEGDVFNEGDIIVINPLPVDDEEPIDDDGGPILGENGDDGGPILGENGPVLGGNGMALQNSSGTMQGQGDVKTANQNNGSTTTSFEDIAGKYTPTPVSTEQAQKPEVNTLSVSNPSKSATISDAEYWQMASGDLLAMRENSREGNSVNHPNNSGNTVRPETYPSSQSGSVRNPSRIPTTEEVQAGQQAQQKPIRGNDVTMRPTATNRPPIHTGGGQQNAVTQRNPQQSPPQPVIVRPAAPAYSPAPAVAMPSGGGMRSGGRGR